MNKTCSRRVRVRPACAVALSVLVCCAAIGSQGLRAQGGGPLTLSGTLRAEQPGQTPYQVIVPDACRRSHSLFTQALCVIFKALVQWRLLLETASLHDGPPSPLLSEAGSVMGRFPSPIDPRAAR